jgi:hypothetical protein
MSDPLQLVSEQVQIILSQISSSLTLAITGKFLTANELPDLA